MDFSFDEEQTLLRTSLSKLLNEVYEFGSRQEIVYGDPELSNKIWTRFSELGLTALPFDENLDGLGGRPSDIVAVSELFGKFAVVEPYLSVVFLSQLLQHADPEQHRSLVEDVMTGRSRIALAHEEPHNVGAPDSMQSVVSNTTNGATLSGEKRLVLGAQGAAYLLVTAKCEDGFSLLKIDPNARGVSLTTYRTIDGRQAADVSFDEVSVSQGDRILHDAETALHDALDRVRLALCAEAVGAMQELLELSADYASTRKQFDKPIGQFQSVAHRLADMKVACTKALSHLLQVTALADADRATSRDVALLKLQVGRLSQSVGESAIQLHGGIGMTDELVVSHLFKRCLANGAMLGNADFHARVVGSSAG